MLKGGFMPDTELNSNPVCVEAGMLNRLEQQVKQQENQWIKQIQALESKVESLWKEKDILSRQVQMQNGCSKEKDDIEHNFKCDTNINKDSKHTTSILMPNANATSAATVANS